MSASPLSAGPVACTLQTSFATNFVATAFFPFIMAAIVMVLRVGLSCGRAVRVSAACRRHKRADSTAGPTLSPIRHADAGRGAGVDLSVMQPEGGTNKPRLDWPAMRLDLREWWADRRPHAVAVSLLSLAFMPVVNACFTVLNCATEAPIDGAVFLRADMTVACGVGTHALIRIIATALLVAVGAGFPLFSCVRLWRVRSDTLRRRGFSTTWGLLYSGFRVPQAPLSNTAPARDPHLQQQQLLRLPGSPPAPAASVTSRSQPDLAYYGRRASIGWRLADLESTSATQISPPSLRAGGGSKSGDRSGRADVNRRCCCFRGRASPISSRSPTAAAESGTTGAGSAALTSAAVLDLLHRGGTTETRVANPLVAAAAPPGGFAAAPVSASPAHTVGPRSWCSASAAAACCVAALRAGSCFAWLPRPRHYLWWESAILFRKLGVVLLGVAVTDAATQITGMTVLTLVALAAHVRAAPYTLPLFNVLEGLALAAILSTSVLSGLLTAPAPMAGASVQVLAAQAEATVISDSKANTVTVVLLLLNGATIAVLLAAVVRFGCAAAQQQVASRGAVLSASLRRLSSRGSIRKRPQTPSNQGAFSGASAMVSRKAPAVAVGAIEENAAAVDMVGGTEVAPGAVDADAEFIRNDTEPLAAAAAHASPAHASAGSESGRLVAGPPPPVHATEAAGTVLDESTGVRVRRAFGPAGTGTGT